VIGPLLLAVSWLLLRLEGKRLEALGLNAPRLRATQCAAGFLAAGAVVTIQQVGLSSASGVAWQSNPDFGLAALLRGARLNVNSVLYEELVFRGYLLFQTIRWLGTRRAVVLGAAAFGVYHWFSYGVIGNPLMMAFVFAWTGAFGLMLAVAFATTKSLAAPVGLHLGWNTTAYLAFSGGPFGPGHLVPANGAPKMDASGVMGLLLNVGLPLAFISWVVWYQRAALVTRRSPLVPSV
jgi:membrane protease YdiL (CAAX protease family)